MFNQNQNQICLEIEKCSENVLVESEIGRTTVEIILKLNVCCYALDKYKERNFETKLERIKKIFFDYDSKHEFLEFKFLNVHLFGKSKKLFLGKL
jgi:hypothetical protein